MLPFVFYNVLLCNFWWKHDIYIYIYSWFFSVKSDQEQIRKNMPMIANLISIVNGYIGRKSEKSAKYHNNQYIHQISVMKWKKLRKNDKKPQIWKKNQILSFFLSFLIIIEKEKNQFYIHKYEKNKKWKHFCGSIEIRGVLTFIDIVGCTSKVVPHRLDIRIIMSL